MWQHDDLLASSLPSNGLAVASLRIGIGSQRLLELESKLKQHIDLQWGRRNHGSLSGPRDFEGIGNGARSAVWRLRSVSKLEFL
mmetsp:Transcript_35061/g.70092  ORF Transcript_35061/g.70092 Transcript_35061/m.70092 type:complete len:84 (-) Transcript_35061:321-572(-)